MELLLIIGSVFLFILALCWILMPVYIAVISGQVRRLERTAKQVVAELQALRRDIAE